MNRIYRAWFAGLVLSAAIFAMAGLRGCVAESQKPEAVFIDSDGTRTELK